MKTNNSSFDDIFFRFSRAMKHDMAFESVTAKLTMQQIHALFFLHQQKIVQMKDIADYFHCETPTATSLFNKLVAFKLVKRQNDKRDRRAVNVCLTSKGEEVVAEALKRRSEKMSKMLALLSQQDKAKLLEILEKVVISLEKQYEK